MRLLIMKCSILLSLIIVTICPSYSQQYIANYSVAKEEVLRSIPAEFINKARTELIVAYQHTSHGTHVVRGIYGLPDFKTGDEIMLGVSTSQQADKLDFRDYALTTSSPAGIDASDLSIDETAFIQTTRNYLDKPQYADVNVIMWSWCNIAGHDVAGNYLPGMDSLIAEYGPGGTKIGSGEGQRELPVTFIFMTGHANKNANVGELNSKSQAALITEHCNTHGYYCLDYYSIDTHDMDDNYWEDTGENGDSDAYGGNFYEDWQNSHVLGEHYFENKMAPGGEVNFGQHNTQHITSNRKGYAMWWILARIAGWEGNLVNIPIDSINVSSEGGVTDMYTGSSLQFSAEVLPLNASNIDITWSVLDQTGSGSITEEGLLTAISEGTIDVIANANDGSGVTGIMTIQIIENSTSLKEINFGGVHIYPNPGKGKYFFQHQGIVIECIKIFNINGTEVFASSPEYGDSVFSIDLSSYDSGLYICFIKTDQKVYYKRIVVLP